jgi:DNA-binding HxlR family transcriptional regulator
MDTNTGGGDRRRAAHRSRTHYARRLFCRVVRASSKPSASSAGSSSLAAEALLRAMESVSASRVAPAPAIPYKSCPIRASLGSLGRKWSMMVLRDIAFIQGSTFATIRRNNPGLGSRTLSLRLKQLQSDGLIERADPQDRSSGYRLTEKGLDTVPVLTALIQFGVKHLAAEVFPDGRARSLGEVFPIRRDFLVGDLAGYVREGESVGRSARRGPTSG